MRYDNKNIVIGELIGLHTTVAYALDRRQIGISGVVVDETAHTIRIRRGGGYATIIKSNASFCFSDGKSTFFVEGSEIDFSPEDRLEKSLRYYSHRRASQNRKL